MSNMILLTANGNATNNPNPNTLNPVSPYASQTDGRFTAQASWKALNKPAIIAKYADTGYLAASKCRLDFNPSGAAVTYTVTLWVFDRVSQTWYVPQDGGTASFTGPITTYLYNFGSDPWFVQFTNVSTGNVAAYYDSEVFQTL